MRFWYTIGIYRTTLKLGSLIHLTDITLCTKFQMCRFKAMENSCPPYWILTFRSLSLFERHLRVRIIKKTPLYHLLALRSVLNVFDYFNSAWKVCNPQNKFKILEWRPSWISFLKHISNTFR